MAFLYIKEFTKIGNDSGKSFVKDDFNSSYGELLTIENIPSFKIRRIHMMAISIF